MMKKLSLLFLPAAIGMMAAGCARIEPEETTFPIEEEEEILIERSFRADALPTRTTLDGVELQFAKGESLSIWDGTGNREYKADEAGSSVSFSGEVSASATEFHALTPYSASTRFAASGSTVTAATTLPSAQTAVAGTFADGLYIAAGKSDADDSFHLDNLLSVAKVTLSAANLGGHAVTSIALTSAAYPLAGDVTVAYGETATVAAGSSTYKTVTIARTDGSALEDGVYYFVLLPNAGGQISLTFTASDGYTATKTATLKSAFAPGTIKNLGTVKGLNWQAPKYVKVTSTPAEWTGDYLLVYEDSKWILGGIGTVNSNSVGTIIKDVEIGSDHTISWEDYKAYNISVAASGNGYSLYLNGAGYLGWSSGNTLIKASSVSSNNYRWTLSLGSDGNVLVSNLADNSRTIWTNPDYPRFCAYSALGDHVKAIQIYRKTAGAGGAGTDGPSVALTTGAAAGIADASAVLNASYSGLNPINVQEVGFYWGTDASSLTRMAYDNSAFTTSSGTISATITSLSANTTYYYQATMQVWDAEANTYVEFKGAVKSFTTAGATPVTGWKGWLELPANTLTASQYIYDEQMIGSSRNYVMSYDTDMYTAMWVAYPLYSATMGDTKRPTNWSYNAHFDANYQVNITTKSYGVSWTESYGNELYARGHQIPNADRNIDSEWQGQTFLVTNSTPQIQNRFNGSVWSSLENAVRDVAKNADTLYVVTGPTFRKVGGIETIKYINPQLDLSKSVPVPNYYWKVLLKVKWSGSGSNKTVSSASAIGFWFEHRSYEKTESYSDSEHIVSVDQIEAWTGLDLFTNLPDAIETTAEKNTSWSSFQSF